MDELVSAGAVQSTPMQVDHEELTPPSLEVHGRAHRVEHVCAW